MREKMGKRFRRGRRTTGRASAATLNKEEYEAPTLGLKKVTFTEGTMQDAARFEDVLNKIARNVGTQPWSQSSVAAKAMGELLAPVFTEPTKPVQKYYVHLERDAVVPTPRVQATQRMHTAQVNLNVPVDDELDWKLELAEYTSEKMEYKKDMKDWAGARIYHLVLLHCPPGFIAELQNHSKWINGNALQDCITLLLMIRDLTHSMKETRQGTMALVQVHVDLFTTMQRPNESVEAYYKLFCARRDTVNAHGDKAGFHKELYAKARKKTMAEKSRYKTFMDNAAGDVKVLVAVTAIKKQARKVSCDQFLAALF